MNERKYFGAGIKVTAGFDLNSKSPLDNRTVVENKTELDNMLDIQKYNGLIVFVENEGSNYQYINNTWQKLVEDSLTSTNTWTALSSNKGKAINDSIVAHKNDAVAHITIAERNKWNAKSDAHTHPYRPDTWVPGWADVTGKPSFASVATSGSYNDLLNKPTIHTINDTSTTSTTNTWSAKKVNDELSKKSNLTHNHNNATSDMSGFMSKEDKAKLDGIGENANQYVHPSTHPATMITQDSTHRFVSDTEKSTWNAKASTAIVTSSANGLMIAADKTKLDGISVNAKKVEKSTTNGNILIDGTQTIVYTHPSGTNPHGTTKSDIGLGNVTNESKTTMFTNPSFTGTVSIDTTKLFTETGVLGGGGKDAVLRQAEGSNWSELRVADGDTINNGVVIRTSTNSGTAWSEVARITSGAFTYKGNKVYHAGAKPTLSELGALSNSSTSEQVISGAEYRVQSTTSASRFSIEFNETEESLDFVYYLS